MISTLLDYCQGLITIDRDTSTVRLIHRTLREYLFTHPALLTAHWTMAEICLMNLNFENVGDPSPNPFPKPQSTPFLEYPSFVWRTHMKVELPNGWREFALIFPTSSIIIYLPNPFRIQLVGGLPSAVLLIASRFQRRTVSRASASPESSIL